MQEWKDPYRPPLPHVVTINGTEQPVSPPTPEGEGTFPTLPPPRIRASSSQQMIRKTPIPLLVPHTGLRTRVHRRFSLELARCSNSVSHSNKLYFPLILSHVWKFFSNLSPDHNTGERCWWLTHQQLSRQEITGFSSYFDHRDNILKVLIYKSFHHTKKDKKNLYKEPPLGALPANVRSEW